MGGVCAMSALRGSEDLDDNFREVLRDRCIVLLEEMSGEQLLHAWGTLQRISEG